MIGFAACIGNPEKFARHAVRGLALCAEADSPVAEITGHGSIFTAYNEALDAFADVDGLEALVLLHEDVELVDPGFCSTLRGVFAAGDVGVAGVVGARGVPGLAWWNGQPFGRVTDSVKGLHDYGGGLHDVDALDGLLLALSPWAVRNLRFDADRYHGFHGYDADLCFTARAAGKRVVVADLPVVHHTKGGYGDEQAWLRADATFRAKWLGGAAALAA